MAKSSITTIDEEITKVIYLLRLTVADIRLAGKVRLAGEEGIFIPKATASRIVSNLLAAVGDGYKLEEQERSQDKG